VSYRAIIFDLDGTLVNTLEDLANAANYALGHFGQPGHSVDACRRMIGNGLTRFVERALAADKQHLRDEVLHVMRARYRDKCFEYSYLYEGVAETVEELRLRGVVLAILTNKDQSEAERIVWHFFGPDIVVEGRAVKPDRGVTMELMESMGLAANDFLLVGDSEVDVLTASAADIRSVGAGWGFRGRTELVKVKADIIIDRPSEILDLLT